jgi:hypothetical protein
MSAWVDRRRRTGVYGCSTSADISAVTAAHPRPDFKRQILAAFTNGFKDRPDTTFGTNAASLSAVAGRQPVTISFELRACRGCDRPGWLGECVPALPGLGEEAQAGPFGELGEHVAGLDAEQGCEVASGPVASGLAP